MLCALTISIALQKSFAVKFCCISVQNIHVVKLYNWCNLLYALNISCLQLAYIFFNFLHVPYVFLTILLSILCPYLYECWQVSYMGYGKDWQIQYAMSYYLLKSKMNNSYAWKRHMKLFNCQNQSQPRLQCSDFDSFIFNVWNKRFFFTHSLRD